MNSENSSKKLLILPFLGMLAMAGLADGIAKPYSDPLCHIFDEKGACA